MASAVCEEWGGGGDAAIKQLAVSSKSRAAREARVTILPHYSSITPAFTPHTPSSIPGILAWHRPPPFRARLPLSLPPSAHALLAPHALRPPGVCQVSYKFWDYSRHAWADVMPPACLLQSEPKPGPAGWSFLSGSPRTEVQPFNTHVVYRNLWYNQGRWVVACFGSCGVPQLVAQPRKVGSCVLWVMRCTASCGTWWQGCCCA